MNYFFLRIFSFWRILPTLTFVVFVSPLVIVLLSLAGDYSDNWTHLYNFVLGDYITNSIFLVLGVGLISLIISFLFLLLFIFYFFSKEPIVKRTSFTLLLVLLFLIGITTKISLHAYEKNHLEKYAIIFSSKIEIKSEPNQRSENLLILHMGTKVKIIDSFNDEWVKIKLVNGQEGWINNNEIKII
mgnify:CR=1 FL=1